MSDSEIVLVNSEGNVLEVTTTVINNTIDVQTPETLVVAVAENILSGPRGPIGNTGAQGPIGNTGPGVSSGGNTGQFLIKSSNDDYDTEWIDLDISPAYNQANTATDIAIGAFEAANNAVTDFSPAYNQANTATDIAVAAYGEANTKLSQSGGTISGSLSITGNLNVLGDLTSFSANNLVINDPFILLANNNTGDVLDIGIVAHYDTDLHTGIFRSANTKQWYLFKNYDEHFFYDGEGNIDLTANNFTLDVLNADIKTNNLYIGTTNVEPWISSSFNKANNALANTTGTFAGNLTVAGSLSFSGSDLVRTTGDNFNLVINGRNVISVGGSGIQTIRTAAGAGLNFVNTDSGATRFFVGSNVGIGTTAPTYKFEVNGDIASLTSGLSSFRAVGSGNFPGRFRIEDSVNNRSFQWLYDNRNITYGNGLSLTLDSAVAIVKFPHSGSGTKSILLGDGFNGTNLVSSVSVSVNSASITSRFVQFGSGDLISAENSTGSKFYITNDGKTSVGGSISTAKLTVANGTSFSDIHNYGTYTDASNYERLNISANANGSFIQTQSTGTGVTRPLYLGANNQNGILLTTNNRVRIGRSLTSTTSAALLHVSDAGDAGALNDPQYAGSLNYQVVIGSNINNADDVNTIILGSGSYGNNPIIRLRNSSGNKGYIGWAGDAAYFFAGTADSKQVRLRTNNSDRVTIDGNGNFGIGTTAPATSFHVTSSNSSTNVSSTATSTIGPSYSSTMILQQNFNAANTFSALSFYNAFDIQASIGTQFIGTGFGAGGDLFFNTRSSGGSGLLTEKVRIKSGGNVGIGNSNPSHALSVNGSIHITQDDRLWSGSNNLRLGNYPQLSVVDTLRIDGGRQSIVFGGTGAYATIGSTVPWDFQRGTTPQGIRIYGTSTDASNYERLSISSNANGSFIQVQNAGTGTARPLYLGSNNSINMTIDTAGRVGIGTTTPSASLDVISFPTVSSQARMSGSGVFNSDDTYGVIGIASRNGGNPDVQIGVYGSGRAGISGRSIGGYFTLGGSENLNIPSFNRSSNSSIIGALVADNGTLTDPIFIAQDSGNTVFTIVDGGNVGVGTTTPAYRLEVNGSFAAQTKSFIIDHQTKPDHKLRHGSLEGPENGVYVRGRSTSNIIDLPDYWKWLIDEDTITVNLTSIGKSQKLYVEKIENNKVYVVNDSWSFGMNYFYTVFAERKDVEKLQVEIPR